MPTVVGEPYPALHGQPIEAERRLEHVQDAGVIESRTFSIYSFQLFGMYWL